MLNFLSYLGRVVEIIYIDRNGKLTQRRIRLISVADGYVRGYCFTRKATRYFSVRNILALIPEQKKQVG
ncbi:hypothetical protein [Aneurinibacillus tyrosinisolvens]|uniref:hypothetical protein n=1 Tax=Aneurinibacillus tyrosinisolvens TaxID=1443435 RepID=UPI00063F18F2|nr:hypothetical protein [Aneurinibacillus tyrosinisolvens]